MSNSKEERLKKELDKKTEEAKELLQDEDKLESVLERMERKLNLIPVAGEYVASIPTMISLVRSYVRKEYTKIPYLSVAAIVGALLYFLTPIDLIPDAVPGLGYLDDAGVIGVAFKFVKDDIDEYKDWQMKNGKRSSEKVEDTKKKKKK